MKFEANPPKALLRLMYCAMVWPVLCTLALALFSLSHNLSLLSLSVVEISLSLAFVVVFNRTLLNFKKAHQEELGKIQQLHILTSDLQRSVEIRDDFISIASHELKTPLSTLILHLQILEKYFKESRATKNQLERAFSSISGQAKKLTDLIDSLFDSTKIKTGNFELKYDQIDLTILVQEQIERIRELWHHSKSTINLKSPTSMTVVCDRFRIEQVMVNLLTNAMKYGDGKPVEFTLDEEETWAIIKIKDNGIGIDKSKLEVIFNRYERAVSSRQGGGGLGLGLFIVKQNVLSHGGTIEVQSDLGRGSLFKVKIPKVPTDTQVFGLQKGPTSVLASMP